MLFSMYKCRKIIKSVGFLNSNHYYIHHMYSIATQYYHPILYSGKITCRPSQLTYSVESEYSISRPSLLDPIAQG